VERRRTGMLLITASPNDVMCLGVSRNQTRAAVSCLISHGRRPGHQGTIFAHYISCGDVESIATQFSGILYHSYGLSASAHALRGITWEAWAQRVTGIHVA
jgi:hypothetical protein